MRMFLRRQRLDIWVMVVLVISIDYIHGKRQVNHAEWRTLTKRVTAEYGSDLSLSCAFHHGDSDETIVQWLYQNRTDFNQRRSKTHWKPLFLNAQSLTPKETRYSIQQKTQRINRTSMTHSTILTLSKVTDIDEGLYMCKSLSPKTIQMTYQLRVIESLDITPKQLFIRADEQGLYSIRLNCIIKDHHITRRHHEISWWHNNRRLGSQTSRYARITKNLTEHSLISSLFYTGELANVAGNYICESEPLRRYISVELQANKSAILWINLYIMWIGIWPFIS